ncbi:MULTISPECIES: hypothetical protein [Leptospira]|uniref:Uncharacterized protein n=3 Tax=Leptospira interrogans TaxID=173 RepID=M6GMV6_LEPIR|nr:MULTISPECIES: hypothetical protein [Leptospira]EMM83889.1 hypothetical protein LEP1GSC037_4657 [Leptospira interrogans str. 2006001854]KAA1293793.1 hypothetical protein C4X99_01555 [Leptospira interrogans serovar Geyaweera]EMJ37945.1 hypothetical protein LEP1GSC079_1846 [Leptospira interrogans str. FPW1039]KGE26921.1 hypothetical protein IQ65_09845 [Leptospira interrogans serovar Lai]QCO33084.1 hypothetical protein E4414_08365 [Leptospira interrogans]
MATAILNSNTLKLVPFVVEMETRKNTAVSSPVIRTLRIVLFPVRVLLRLLGYIFPISEWFLEYFYNLEIRLLNFLERYGNFLHHLSIEECDRDYHKFLEILDIYERILSEMNEELESSEGSNFESKHYELLKQIVEKMRSIEATLDLLSIPDMREALFKELSNVA